jgi:hypothetical protein
VKIKHCAAVAQPYVIAKGAMLVAAALLRAVGTILAVEVVLPL